MQEIPSGCFYSVFPGYDQQWWECHTLLVPRVRKGLEKGGKVKDILQNFKKSHRVKVFFPGCDQQW